MHLGSHHPRPALGLLLALLLLPCWPAEAQDEPAPVAEQPVSTREGREYYRIGPSDVLEIIVWKEAGISRSDVLVRPDGRISLPLVDDVLVAGHTPVEVKEIITKRLLKYVELPQVYVTVKDPQSKFCCVLGNVRQPGRYEMLTPTNVLQALAMAGGFNEWADKDDVVIIRSYRDRQRFLPFEYSEVVSGEALQQNFLLQAGDVIVVP